MISAMPRVTSQKAPPQRDTAGFLLDCMTSPWVSSGPLPEQDIHEQPRADERDHQHRQQPQESG